MEEFVITGDGSSSIRKPPFNEYYHSIKGAITESKHVFILAGLHFCINNNSRNIKILEYGYGTGLNAWLTFLESRDLPNIQINYTGLELYPLSLEDIRHLNFGIQQEDSALFRQIHQKHFKVENFESTIIHLDFEEYIAKETYDLIYHDAFAPTCQSQFWEESFLKKSFLNLKEGGVLVTYCAKGSFKRALKAVGFEVNSLQGPPGKREMTRAIKPYTA